MTNFFGDLFGVSGYFASFGSIRISPECVCTRTQAHAQPHRCIRDRARMIAYAHARTRMCMHVSLFTRARAHVHERARTCARACACASVRKHARTFACACIHFCADAHMSMLLNMREHACTRTHVHLHAHLRRFGRDGGRVHLRLPASKCIREATYAKCQRWSTNNTKSRNDNATDDELRWWREANSATIHTAPLRRSTNEHASAHPKVLLWAKRGRQ